MPKPAPEFAGLVKKTAIIAMFSDDVLMDRLVLKGGNLLDIIYAISSRSSVDVDFSIDGELGDVTSLKARIHRVLSAAFAEIGYELFDLNLREVPKNLSVDLGEFWGGYQIDFKIISGESYRKFGAELGQIRRNA